MFCWCCWSSVDCVFTTINQLVLAFIEVNCCVGVYAERFYSGKRPGIKISPKGQSFGRKIHGFLEITGELFICGKCYPVSLGSLRKGLKWKSPQS